jgi:hypothetical protein
MSTERKENFGLGFKKGWDQVKRNCTEREIEDITSKIMRCLDINNRSSFSKYKLGRLQMKAQQALMLEDIFKMYKIKDIWGE